MDFRTQLPPIESPFQLRYQDTILSLGSCFAEHIGQRLASHKFSIQLNPFGIIYNPLSILQRLELLQADTLISQDQLFFQNDLWHHYAFHGRFSHPKPEVALTGMNQSIQKARQILSLTNRVLLTWGTSYAYRHQKTQQVVSNCHKMPSATFEHFRLESADFVPLYQQLLSDWKTHSPELEVVISVSPVRHLRNGLIENQRSKAILLLAAETLVEKLDFVHYFPAYELIQDDLRDYRFFNADLSHPNELAVDYVWDYFKNSCLSPTAKKVLQQIEPIKRASAHRPFHTDTPAFQRFCAQQLNKIDALQAQYPFLDFSEEQRKFGRN